MPRTPGHACLLLPERATAQVTSFATAVALGAVLGLASVGGAAAGHPDTPWFEDVTASSGIRFAHVNGGPDQQPLIDQNGQGIAVLDFDSDGMADLLFLNGSTLARRRSGADGFPPALYRNRGDGTFEDVTTPAGIPAGRWDVGAAVADLDDDGFPDVFVTGYGPDRLLRNNGDGTFAPVAGALGAADPGWGSSASFGDTDGDGDLDLVVANYVHFDPDRMPVAEADGTPCRYRGAPTGCAPWCWSGQGPEHYTRVGPRFVRTTARVGLAAEHEGRCFQALLQDLDADGDLDLYVGCDVMPNICLANDGHGRFRLDPTWGGLVNGEGRHESGMGLACGDLEGDGLPEVFLTNFAGQKNVLYSNRPPGPRSLRLTDVTTAAGLDGHRPELGWGTALADLDLDGRLDVIVVNGHIYPQVGSLADPTDTYRQPPRLYRGLPGGRFQEVSCLASSGARWCARALALLDIDNDGALDVVAGVHNGSPRVLANRTRSGRRARSTGVLVELVGTGSNRGAIGARLDIEAAGDRMVRWATPHQGFQGTQDARIHIGLPSGAGRRGRPARPARIERLRVTWPGGTVSAVVPEAHPGTVLRLIEPAPPAGGDTTGGAPGAWRSR